MRRNQIDTKLGRLFTMPMLVSFVLLAVIVLAVLFANLLATHDPNALSLAQSLQKPSAEHLLGTDVTGRDVFSRILYGGRTTLLSALLVVLISNLIGIPLGLLSGYYGGVIDSLLMRVSDILCAFPSLLLAFILVAGFGRGLQNAIFALGVIYIPMIAKLTRSLVLVEKSKVYVEAARTLGYGDMRILFMEILPNCISTVLIQVTLDIGYAILDLAAMSFLGLGVQPPTSDWGAMLEEGRSFLATNPIQALAPGILIIISVVSINILSDGMRAYLDPAQRKMPSRRAVRRLLKESNG